MKEMRKLIETAHVSLGGEIGSVNDWVFPYLYVASATVRETCHADGTRPYRQVPRAAQSNGVVILTYTPT